LASDFEAGIAADQRADETDASYQERIETATEWLTDECGGMTDATLAELFWKMADFANEYWSNEQGSDSYIDVEDVVKALDRKQDSDYTREAHAEIVALIRSGMGERKYELGIVRYQDPNQLSLTLETTEVN